MSKLIRTLTSPRLAEGTAFPTEMALLPQVQAKVGTI